MTKYTKFSTGAALITMATLIMGLLGPLPFAIKEAYACHCGDGKINVIGEECDDGNTQNGDGCSSDCKTEDWCNECDGKIVWLTLRYDGSNSATIKVMQKKPGGTITVFNNTVSVGGQFSFIGTDNGTLGTEITLYVNDVENTKIHTSCSVNIYPGLVSGDFTVINGASKDGGLSLACICGDGILDQAEQCDDGNTQSGDGCSSTCTLEECELELTKTDSVDPVNPGDELIYYLTLENVGTANCTGTGVRIQDFFDQSTTYVSSSKSPESITSEYIKWNVGTLYPEDIKNINLTMLVSEDAECDSVLINKAKFWSNQTGWGDYVIEETTVECPEEPFCGDETVDEGEECDNGPEGSETCTSECTLIPPEPEPYCGDETVDEGEECDDGNNEDGDGCSAVCTIETPGSEPECGDGNLDEGEECDDGNLDNGDGCSATCTIEDTPPEPYCGDEIINNEEECDDGPEGSETCTSECVIIEEEPYCGDYEINQEGEECDDGEQNGQACSPGCESSCTYCSTECTIIELTGGVCGRGGNGGGGGGGSTPNPPKRPTLTIDKSVAEEFANPNSLIAYTIVVTNTGPGIAYNAILDDDLSKGFSYDDPAIIGEWDLGKLKKGDSETITFLVRVGDGVAAGTYINSAETEADNHSPVSDDAAIEIRIPVVLGEMTELTKLVELPDTGATTLMSIFWIIAVITLISSTTVLIRVVPRNFNLSNGNKKSFGNFAY